MQKQVWDINKLLTWAIDYFKTKNIPNPRLSAELLLSSVLNLSRMELYLKYDYILNEQQLKKYKEFILRRLEHEPIQYITGEAYFRKIKLTVDRNVLIPRPETELVVEKAKQIIQEIINLKKESKESEKEDKQNRKPINISENTSVDNINDNFFKPVNILEVGVGSGAIAISLIYEENFNKDGSFPFNIIATDISKAAIEVASKNANLILSPQKIKNLIFFECDVIPEDNKEFVNKYFKNIDLVISNPPYISQKDYENLNREIKNFEPETALNAGITGTETYKHIIEKVKNFLNPQVSFIIFETDPKTSIKLQELIKNEFKTPLIKVEKDYNNSDRILVAEIKKNQI